MLKKYVQTSSNLTLKKIVHFMPTWRLLIEARDIFTGMVETLYRFVLKEAEEFLEAMNIRNPHEQVYTPRT